MMLGHKKSFTSTLFVIAVSVSATSFAESQAGGQAPSVSSDRCAALQRSDLANIQDAPTQVVSAAVIDAKDRDPAYCQVKGYIWPQVGFELRLPLTGWNGKFLEVGAAGWGGGLTLFLCDGPLRKGYACIASDMGHQGSGALWAANNLQAQVDFGYRSAHVAALAGKAIVERYYARWPSKSLMLGCSTGGYQGMVEAQRFPWDFDGIVAMAPDIEDEADLGMRIIWHMRHVLDQSGRPLFDDAELGLLHRAALAQCDMTDGVRDGVVGDPLGCRFDPAVLACKSGQDKGCLSTAQVAAARSVYSGPMTSDGKRISTRGVFPGSELQWNQYDSGWATELFKHALFTPTPGPEWKFTDFDFDRDYQRLGSGALYTDSNPDLRKFKAAGGKLLVSQGGTDTDEIPGAIFDYYETVERTMGGAANTQDFFRLFLVPGMNHCSGGDGAFAIDYLTYLENWVERGKAPQVMIGAHVPSFKEGFDAFMHLTFPMDPKIGTAFTRPVYPYPLRARYKGHGDASKAENFEPVGP